MIEYALTKDSDSQYTIHRRVNLLVCFVRLKPLYALFNEGGGDHYVMGFFVGRMKFGRWEISKDKDKFKHAGNLPWRVRLSLEGIKSTYNDYDYEI